MIAVLIPCYNEGITIAKVVADFRAALPDAVIYVYDNNSTDGTQALANGAGAIVRRETLQGKGHVVRRMFADVEADIYVLVDGDGTYDAHAAPAMIAMLVNDAPRYDHWRPQEHCGGRLSAPASRTCCPAIGSSVAASSSHSLPWRPGSRRRPNLPFMHCNCGCRLTSW